MREKIKKKGNNKKITFLLGAGASFGHLSKDKKTPPTMKNFLSSSVDDNVLTEDEFPELVQYIQQQEPGKSLIQACRSIEVSSNLESFFGNIDDIWVLHLGLFYISRYLGKFCNNSISSSSAYMQLANYVRDNLTRVRGIINLNYDTLLDYALMESKIVVDYGLQVKKSGSLFHIKPHGSLNFRCFYAKYIDHPCCSWREFIKQKNSTILYNQFSGDMVEVYMPTFDFDSDFFSEGKLKYIPVIVMPIGKNKNYFQFESCSNTWSVIRDTLSDTSELIAIGCAANEEDEELWKNLKSMDRNVSIKIVSGDKNSAEQIAKNLINILSLISV